MKKLSLPCKPAGFKHYWKYQMTLAKKSKVSYAFVFPYMLLFTLFTILPVLISVFLSFTTFNMMEPPTFVGIDNYLRLFFSDGIFPIALRNTLLIAVVTGPIGYLMSLMLAWFINELPRTMRAIVTVIYYSPTIAGNVYLIWALLFSGDSYGYVNSLLIKLGIIQSPILWLQNPDYILPIAIVVILWLSLGAGFLALIAGFQGVDRSYYEAAAVDGIKNRFQELWFVTLPIMKNQLMFSAVMTITASFGVGDVITGLFGYPTTRYTAQTLMNHLSDYGSMRVEMGYASAIATLLFFMMVFTNQIIKKMLSKIGV